MKIVIDVQGIQSASRFRGIGRYSHSLMTNLLPKMHEQDVWIILNENFKDNLKELREIFETYIPSEKIIVYKTPSNTNEANDQNIQRAQIAKMIREQFISLLSPDLLLITSLFEGYHDDAIVSIKEFASDIRTAVILYDLIPLIHAKDYLKIQEQKSYYENKINSLKQADMFLSISNASKQEAIKELGFDGMMIFNISTAVENDFTHVSMPSNDIQNFLNHYGLKPKFVLYVPGGFDTRKNCERLMEAYSKLSLSVREEHQLVIASKIADNTKEYLLNLATEYGLQEKEFALLGYVCDEDLKALYSLCKLFVFPSLHEGFGLPILEAMSCGAAVIGSNATSIPEVIGNEQALFDPYSQESITSKMQQALNSQEFLDNLKRKAHEHKKNFSWEQSSDKAFDALMSFKSTTLKADPIYQDKLIQSINDKTYALSEYDKIAIADCIAYNNSVFLKPQLLVDISELVKRDAKSGIQRVVRSILSYWIYTHDADFDIKPIYFDGEMYRYANNFLLKNFNIIVDNEDFPISFNQQDRYIGLDLNAHIIHEIEPWLLRFKMLGMKIAFVVYDLLLLQSPHWWPKGTSEMFENWVKSIVKVADVLVCISQAVADDLEDTIQKPLYAQQKKFPKIKSFHLGADIANSLPTKGLPDDAAETLMLLSSKPTFLTVGTLEPRKGHQQLLDAFEELWQEGYEINLAIVGKQGWMVEELCSKLESHPKRNHKLFWFDAISDEYLESIYEASACLIASSEAEGFGLPLIEAAQKSLPIIARDIPVFKEIAKDHAFYFENTNDASSIKEAIEKWLLLKGSHPDSSFITYLTWDESAKQLLKTLKSTLL